MGLVAKKQRIDKHARCKILENLLELEVALLGGHSWFPNVRRLTIFLSCARQTTEMQRAQVERSNEEVRNPPGACH